MNEAIVSPPTTRPKPIVPSTARLRTGLIVTLLGLFVVTVGAKPEWFHWNRSRVVGFVQITVFLLGLAIICIGGGIGILGLWKGKTRTIVSDIGVRVVSTGYVISVVAGMADVIGMGSQPLPGIPYFGPWQAIGVVIGQVVIAIGFLMMIPYMEK